MCSSLAAEPPCAPDRAARPDACAGGPPTRTVWTLLTTELDSLRFVSYGSVCFVAVAGAAALRRGAAARALTETRRVAQIRVVNAFRQGLDSRGSLADAALAEALRKQTALSKRYSHSSSIEYADVGREALAPHDIDVERLSSHSHTETAV